MSASFREFLGEQSRSSDASTSKQSGDSLNQYRGAAISGSLGAGERAITSTPIVQNFGGSADAPQKLVLRVPQQIFQDNNQYIKVNVNDRVQVPGQAPLPIQNNAALQNSVDRVTVRVPVESVQNGQLLVPMQQGPDGKIKVIVNDQGQLQPAQSDKVTVRVPLDALQGANGGKQVILPDGRPAEVSQTPDGKIKLIIHDEKNTKDPNGHYTENIKVRVPIDQVQQQTCVQQPGAYPGAYNGYPGSYQQPGYDGGYGVPEKRGNLLGGIGRAIGTLAGEAVLAAPPIIMAATADNCWGGGYGGWGGGYGGWGGGYGGWGRGGYGFGNPWMSGLGMCGLGGMYGGAYGGRYFNGMPYGGMYNNMYANMYTNPYLYGGYGGLGGYGGMCNPYLGGGMGMYGLGGYGLGGYGMGMYGNPFYGGMFGGSPIGNLVGSIIWAAKSDNCWNNGWGGGWNNGWNNGWGGGYGGYGGWNNGWGGGYGGYGGGGIPWGGNIYNGYQPQQPGCSQVVNNYGYSNPGNGNWNNGGNCGNGGWNRGGWNNGGDCGNGGWRDRPPITIQPITQPGNGNIGIAPFAPPAPGGGNGGGGGKWWNHPWNNHNGTPPPLAPIGNGNLGVAPFAPPGGGAGGGKWWNHPWNNHNGTQPPLAQIGNGALGAAPLAGGLAAGGLAGWHLRGRQNEMNLGGGGWRQRIGNMAHNFDPGGGFRAHAPQNFMGNLGGGGWRQRIGRVAPNFNVGGGGGGGGFRAGRIVQNFAPGGGGGFRARRGRA